MTRQRTRRARNAGLVAALIALLLVAAAGCGTEAGDSTNAGKTKSGSSQSVMAKVARWNKKVWRKVTSMTSKLTASKSKAPKGTESKGTTAESTAPKTMASESTTPKSTASKSTVSKSTASKYTASRRAASKRTASKHAASKSMARRSTASRHARSTVAAHRASSSRRVRAKSAATASLSAHIRLTQKGCIEFEPQWTAIRVGQSLTWHSRLKRRVTIHVTPGAFGRTSYVVSPGGTVNTGPARGVGAFSMWCKPAACQGTPRGVQGTGPGVTIVRRGG